MMTVLFKIEKSFYEVWEVVMSKNIFADSHI